MQLRLPTRLALLALLFACGDDPVAPGAGTLPVAVHGLPFAVPAAVTLQGPDGAPVPVTDTREVGGLRPGTYAVTAADVVTGDRRYSATIGRATAAVPPGGRGPVVRVSYALVSGRLALTVRARPAGIPASIAIRGPGFTADVDSSAVLGPLAPGTYTVTAGDLLVNGTTHRPDPATQEVVVVAGAAAAAVHVTYGTGAGELSVGITGLPAGLEADVIVTGPGGYVRPVATSTVLRHLLPGGYTVSAKVVGADLVTFTPSAASQEVAVGPGAVAVGVGYDEASLQLALAPVAEGLIAPVLVTAPEGDSRLFVVERPGRIRVIDGGVMLQQPFLDIASRVNFTGERGMLGLAFHPGYAVNGRFFVFYVTPTGDVAVERFSSQPGANIAGPSDGIVLRIPHGGSEHHGGAIEFGPDHMLYVGPGDGRCCGDPDNNAQNLGSQLGKILRLDVRQLPYAVPVDNPFAVSDPEAARIIWAYGLRNPWRFSFDPPSGLLLIGDVGQDAREEVNAALATAAGLNYGWPRMEGSACYRPSANCAEGLALMGPVHEYTHADGCSVIGGYVYRGSAIPELRGRYLYTDFCAGWLRSMRVSPAGSAEHRAWGAVSAPFTASMGRDGLGELYMIGRGRVWRIIRS